MSGEWWWLAEMPDAAYSADDRNRRRIELTVRPTGPSVDLWARVARL